MLPVEMESKLGMIHFGRFPAIGCVTCSALRSELALMRVILGMAGTAVLRCAFEDTIDMTFLTGHCGMLAVKMEGKQGMIHLCVFPAFGSMAGCTIGSKLTVVMVILFMTGETRLGSGLQISKFAGVDMALGTSQRRVFADKIEWHFIMIKDRAMRINTVVTGHTVRAEGQEVFGGESHVHLQMAITA